MTLLRKKNIPIKHYICDASQYNQLEIIFKENKIDIVINLAGLQEFPNIPTLVDYYKMVDCYLNSTFLLLTLMKSYGVNKMILASSNHVTDYYEKNGYSTLNREINTNDYPISNGVYGTLKLAAENLCRSFNINYGIQSIAFRIGTYRDSFDSENSCDRWNRTRLEKQDLIKYFEKAIENNCTFDVYYLVSDNENKPWDTSNLIKL